VFESFNDKEKRKLFGHVYEWIDDYVYRGEIFPALLESWMYDAWYEDIITGIWRIIVNFRNLHEESYSKILPVFIEKNYFKLFSEQDIQLFRTKALNFLSNPILKNTEKKYEYCILQLFRAWVFSGITRREKYRVSKLLWNYSRDNFWSVCNLIPEMLNAGIPLDSEKKRELWNKILKESYTSKSWAILSLPKAVNSWLFDEFTEKEKSSIWKNFKKQLVLNENHVKNHVLEHVIALCMRG